MHALTHDTTSKLERCQAQIGGKIDSSLRYLLGLAGSPWRFRILLGLTWSIPLWTAVSFLSCEEICRSKIANPTVRISTFIMIKVRMSRLGGKFTNNLFVMAKYYETRQSYLFRHSTGILWKDAKSKTSFILLRLTLSSLTLHSFKPMTMMSTHPLLPS